MKTPKSTKKAAKAAEGGVDTPVKVKTPKVAKTPKAEPATESPKTPKVEQATETPKTPKFYQENPGQENGAMRANGNSDSYGGFRGGRGSPRGGGGGFRGGRGFSRGGGGGGGGGFRGGRGSFGGGGVHINSMVNTPASSPYSPTRPSSPSFTTSFISV